VFRATWVSSGATANPIVFNLFSGSETMVNCWAGVSSGNGFYYADVLVGSRGLWKGSWFPYVSPNSYRYDEYFLGAEGDTDQPGRYITWDDVQNRFTGFADVAGAVRAASHYVSYAEAFIDGKLASKYVTPFSSNNVTVKDLAIDVVQMRALRGQNNDEYKNIRADVNSRLAALLAGNEIMITTSGDQVTLNDALAAGAWSNTSGYHPTFSPVLPDEVLVPSSDFVTAEADDRGLTNT
jgi:hypothetical protein